MTKPRHLIAILSLCLSLLPAQGAAAQYIVANSTIEQTVISRQDIRSMYLNQKPKWSTGLRVKLAIIDQGKDRDNFLRTFIGKNSARFDRHWKRQLFTGKGIPPETFANQEALLNYVRTTPGAIGYVDSETPPETVVILQIID